VSDSSDGKEAGSPTARKVIEALQLDKLILSDRVAELERQLYKLLSERDNADAGKVGRRSAEAEIESFRRLQFEDASRRMKK
jgi:hypothetical protein